MRFRTQFTPYEASIFFTDPGEDEDLVQQHMRDECDVNVIMARYQKTGEISHLGAIAGSYGDFSDVTDYKDGLERIIAADAAFMELPSSIRDRFMNDPAKFIEFCANKDNLDELRDMGLAPPKSVTPSVKVENVEELRSEPKGGARTSSATPAKSGDGD